LTALRTEQKLVTAYCAMKYLRSLYFHFMNFSHLFKTSSRPIILTQYPFAQTKNVYPSIFSSIPNTYQIFWCYFSHLKNPTTFEIEYFGENDNTKWIWSFCTLPSYFYLLPLTYLIDYVLYRLVNFTLKILNLYFGHYTKWYLHSHTTCDNLFNLLIEYLFLLLESPISTIRRYSFLTLLEHYYNRIAKLVV
jgi:hypothetical protein